MHLKRKSTFCVPLQCGRGTCLVRARNAGERRRGLSPCPRAISHGSLHEDHRLISAAAHAPGIALHGLPPCCPTPNLGWCVSDPLPPSAALSPTEGGNSVISPSSGGGAS